MNTLIIVLIALLAGFCMGVFFYHVKTNSDRANAFRRKLANDIKLRLGEDGKPINPLNDYERHLYALKLKLEGKTRNEVAHALLNLGLEDVTPVKRTRYINDVLESVIVGFVESQKQLVVYGEVK